MSKEEVERESRAVNGYMDALEISKDAAIDFIKAHIEDIDILGPMAQKDGIQVIDEIYG